MEVTDLTWETMASNVISRPTNVIIELSAIVKIHKYKGLHKGHHFILMVMEVHDTPECDMYCFIKEYACFSTIDNHKVIYPCLFAFNFSSNVLVLFFNMF